jgi:hypothetical protein
MFGAWRAGKVLSRSLLIALAAAACTTGNERNNRLVSPESGLLDRTGNASRRRYAPRGVSLPDTGAYSVIPEPPRPGDPMPQMANLPNLAGSPDAPKRGRARPQQFSVYNDTWRSWDLPQSGITRGVYAGFDIIEDPLVLPPQGVPKGWIVYAPTALPHGPGCLEVTNFHGEAPPGAGVGVFNWCQANPDWAVLNGINNSNFRNNFTRTYVDPIYGTTRRRYFIMVFAANASGADRSSDTWHALIYNWSLGAWMYLTAPVTGVPGVSPTELGNKGWLMHETRNLAGIFDGRSTGVCYALRSTAASEVAFLGSDGTWMTPDAFAPGVIDFSENVNSLGTPVCWENGKPWSLTGVSSWGWIAGTPSINP